MKRLMPIVAIVACSAGLVACESVELGPTQDITLDINPETARCDGFQQGVMAGRYDSGRHVLTVPRSLGSLEIRCSAAGFKDKRVSVVPDNATEGRIGAFLIDFGYFDRSLQYPLTVAIAMEQLDRPGQPY